MELPTALEPFVDQSPREHALTVLVGVVACAVGYVGTALIVFDLSVLDHGGPDIPRWIAACVASLACWTVYAVAFVRGKGGPVTSAFVYPATTVVVVPVAIRWLVFGPVWSAIRDRIAWVFFDVGILIDGVTLILPGVSMFMFVLSIWGGRLDEAQIREWQRRHLSAEFRDAFIEEADFETGAFDEGEAGR